MNNKEMEMELGGAGMAEKDGCLGSRGEGQDIGRTSDVKNDGETRYGESGAFKINVALLHKVKPRKLIEIDSEIRENQVFFE